MFKTLFSRMLTIYLVVTLGLLLVLGVVVTSVFKSQYEMEKENEMRREIDQINQIIIEKYLDEDKRLVSREELLTIARQYDALIQIVLLDKGIGTVNIKDEHSAAKWAPCEEQDISEIADYVVENSLSGTTTNTMYSNLVTMPIMTYTKAITDNTGGVYGALFFNVDMSATNASIGRVYIDVLIAACISVILAVIVVYYITGRITKPIVSMNATVQEFVRGDFDARVKVLGSDEVSQLGNTFNNMANEINNLEQSRRSFVANVSHELRSPLTSMRGFLEAMHDGTIPVENYGKYLDIVIAENMRMAGMVNDLLDLARIESGEVLLNLQVFDVIELMLRALITFETRINAKNIDVEFDFNTEQCYVYADQNQISQVVRNLIDNAVKFSPEKSKILLSCKLNKKTVTISIKDYGKGIDKEDIGNVFDKFYKAEKAHTPSGSSGTGLGLSIVKRIIDNHGETITVSSVKNEYTEFIFTLKAAQEQQPKGRKKMTADE